MTMSRRSSEGQQAWRVVDSEGATGGAAAGGHRWKKLPEMLSGLPRSFSIGGDLPRVHLGCQELCKISGWRPLMELEVGSVVGALLEETPVGRRLTVVQDGTARCSAEAPVPAEWGDEVYGVVDVCGTVQRVELRQVVAPPAGEAMWPPPTSRKSIDFFSRAGPAASGPSRSYSRDADALSESGGGLRFNSIG